MASWARHWSVSTSSPARHGRAREPTSDPQNASSTRPHPPSMSFSAIAEQHEAANAVVDEGPVVTLEQQRRILSRVATTLQRGERYEGGAVQTRAFNSSAALPLCAKQIGRRTVVGGHGLSCACRLLEMIRHMLGLFELGLTGDQITSEALDSCRFLRPQKSRLPTQ